MNAPVDVEKVLLDRLDGWPVRASTMLREDGAAGSDLDDLPFAWVMQEPGGEQYGPYRTDPVAARFYAGSRDEARELAVRLVGEAGAPMWSPSGLIDAAEVMDGPTREPSGDPSVHCYLVRLAVETRM